MTPLDRLRHHVTGAIERGEAEPIIGVPTFETRLKAALVYQAGIANVFEVDCFNLAGGCMRLTRRLLQADFRTCEAFARGMAAAGATVLVASCNVAGDCANVKWTAGVDATPFREQTAYRNAVRNFIDPPKRRT